MTIIKTITIGAIAGLAFVGIEQLQLLHFQLGYLVGVLIYIAGGLWFIDTMSKRRAK